MNVQYYRAHISQLIPVNSLSGKHFDTLLNKAEIVQATSGDFLFREGETDKMHVYLLDGSVSLESRAEGISRINPGTNETRHPLAHHQPRRHSAQAIGNITYLKIESTSLDMLLSWEHAGNYIVEEITADSEIRESDWMARMLQNPAFQQIPPINLQDLFVKMRPVKFMAGDTVVAQGEMGDFFYVLASGTAMVKRSAPSARDEVTLAELHAGDSFGEEALISNQPRSASVVMENGGTLMRLSKKHFLSLLNTPLIDWISHLEATSLVRRRNAVWLDVRLRSEYEQSHMDNSFNLPLKFLRMKLPTLKPDLKYIVCCDTGGRSSAAAFLLKKHGFDTRVLKGGLNAAQYPEDSLRARIA